MKNERLFKIKGPDGIYDPAKRSEIIMVNDIINSQLILLLIGMVAAFSIRNYKNQKSNITIDIVIAGCGSIIFIAGILHGWIYLTVYGIFMMGIGLMLKISRNLGVGIRFLEFTLPGGLGLSKIKIVYETYKGPTIGMRQIII